MPKWHFLALLSDLEAACFTSNSPPWLLVSGSGTCALRWLPQTSIRILASLIICESLWMLIEMGVERRDWLSNLIFLTTNKRVNIFTFWSTAILSSKGHFSLPSDGDVVNGEASGQCHCLALWHVFIPFEAWRSETVPIVGKLLFGYKLLLARLSQCRCCLVD